MSMPTKTLFFFLIGFSALAHGLYAEDNPATKLGRGIVNVVASPGEYAVQTAKLMKDHDPLTAYLGGVFQGTTRMLQRIGAGVYEVVTFPVPLPKKYKPLMDPPTTVDALQDSRILESH